MNAFAAEISLVTDELEVELILAQLNQGVVSHETDALSRLSQEDSFVNYSSTPRVSLCFQDEANLKAWLVGMSCTCAIDTDVCLASFAG